MSEVQTQTTAASTPPATFGALEASSQAANPVTTPPSTFAQDDKKTDPTPAKDATTVVTPEPAKTATETAADPNKKDEPTVKVEGEKTDPKEAEKTEKPVVPEKYDLKLSEGSLLNKDHLDRIAASAKAQGLSQEQAQELVKTSEGEVATAMKSAIEQRKTQWLEQAKSDKEIGGDNLDKSVKLSIGVLDKYADDAFRKELTDGGFGNHPGLIRMLARIGKASAPDKAIIPKTTEKPVSKNAADVLYDKTPKA